MTSVDAVAIGLKTAGFIAILQAAGIGFFVALCSDLISPPTMSRVRRLATRAAIAALAFVFLHLAMEAGRMGGDFRSVLDPLMQSIALRSSTAMAATWKSAGLLLLIVGITGGRRSGIAVAVLGAAVTCFGFTRAGHTATLAPRAALQALLCVHLLIAAFWFGSLLPLLRVVRDESTAGAAAIVARFSAVATWLVPTLALAGVGLAALLLKDMQQLFTPYGGLLIGKITLFVVIMGLAAWNKWRLGPAILHGGPMAAGRFAVALRLEYLLIAAVFLATAFLTTLFSPGS